MAAGLWQAPVRNALRHFSLRPFSHSPKEMRWVVSEYRTAILARLEAELGQGTDPSFLRQLHHSLYRLQIGEFRAEFPHHQTTRR